MNTDFLFGFSWAFFKVCLVAVAVMVVFWGIGKASVALHRQRRESTDGDNSD